MAGFLIAPIKKGLYCGNNNGNNFPSKEDMEKFIDNLKDGEKKGE